MDFGLSKKHEMARSLFKEFAENEVKPLAQEVDETEKFPTGTVEKMAKYGFLGIPVPKELGGQGCDILTYAMCVEELSKVCGTTGVIVSAHTSLCVDPILTFGTPEQKEKYVPDLASGKKLGAFGLTEPMAGTDAQGQQTKAVLDGDEWVLNGSKCFITNGKEADVYIVIAVTGKIEKRGRTMKEISAFIVEKGTLCRRWHRGRRFQHRYAYTGWRTYRYRCTGTWSCRGCIRDNNRICKRKKTVRQKHRSVPEHTVPVSRHGYKSKSCSVNGIQSCIKER